MMSILSNGVHKNQTLSKIAGIVTKSDGQTFTVALDEQSESVNVEEMHFLMVKVEILK